MFQCKNLVLFLDNCKLYFEREYDFSFCENQIFMHIYWPKNIVQRFKAFNDIHGAKVVQQGDFFSGMTTRKDVETSVRCIA